MTKVQYRMDETKLRNQIPNNQFYFAHPSKQEQKKIKIKKDLKGFSPRYLYLGSLLRQAKSFE